VHLDGLDGARRRLLAPQRERELLAAHGAVRVQQQHRQHRARLGAAERRRTVAGAHLERAQDPELHGVPTVSARASSCTAALLADCKRLVTGRLDRADHAAHHHTHLAPSAPGSAFSPPGERRLARPPRRSPLTRSPLQGASMTRTIIRPLIVALAALALISSPAFARPGGPASAHALAAKETGPVYWSYGYEAPKPDKARVYWSYDYEAAAPPAHAAKTVKADDNSLPWTAIGVGLGAVCLILVAAGTAYRLRPDHATA
jgi:hypothetical protein